MLADRTTLTQFLIEERRRHPDASGELNALILDVALACKAISRAVARGALDGVLGDEAAARERGEGRRHLEVAANHFFLRSNEWGGHLAGIASAAMDAPCAIPAQYPKGRYLLAFAPLDGAPGIDVNVALGSIFSILRAPNPHEDAVAADFLQSGREQVCAGYAIYGPSTMLVLTVGTGVHAFTLDPLLGEFFLTHPDLRIAPATSEFAINASESRFWEPAVKRYVEECLAGSSGSRGKDFSMRWIASLVAETHRILMRGGVFLYPRDAREGGRSERPRALYEANPIAFIVEQAQGRASTGRAAVLDTVAESLVQRTGFIFGSRDEVERIERYHHDHNLRDCNAPLFATRGLFRAAV
ncbi:MAG TPA: class 1 fructose-bisphosphatase [Casimicrobiaceae bacterium]